MMDFRQLVKAGVHFGHQTSRWNPKMSWYIWGHKNGVHLIDVSKTAHQLEKAAQFIESVVARGQQVMFIGTKKSAQDIMYNAAILLDMPYVNHRWIGGTLSNYGQVKKSVTRLLHYEDVLARSEQFPHYTKKELNNIQKTVQRLEKNVGGIRKLSWPVGALVVVDVRKEHSAIKEAVRMGIPVVALVDTNCDPSLVDYVIPGNDDAPRSIRIIIDYLVDAAQKGISAAERAERAEAEQDMQVEEDSALGSLDTADDEEDVDAQDQKRLKKGTAKAKAADDSDDDDAERIQKEKAKPAKDVRSKSKSAK